MSNFICSRTILPNSSVACVVCRPKAGGRLDTPVAKKPADGFVVARPVLEINCCRGVTELVGSDPDPNGPLDAPDELRA